MKIVFLDLDGVLIPTLYRDFVAQWARLSKGAVPVADELLDYFAPHCLAYVRQLLQASGAQLVFTTNRRGETDLTEVARQRFGPDGKLGAILSGLVDCMLGLLKLGIVNADIQEDNVGLAHGRVVLLDIVDERTL